MKLTSEQRDTLMVQIAEKLGIQVDMVNKPEPPVASKIRKPFSDAIGIVEGTEFIDERETMTIIDMALGVEVKKSELEKVAMSLGIMCFGSSGPVQIDQKNALKIWRTYCAKRGW